MTSYLTTPSTSPPNNDLAAQLTEARQQLVKLRKQLADQEVSGLRQRNVSSLDEKAVGSGQLATQIGMQAAPDGVPVKVVAALCLVSFLLALLF